MTMPAMAPAPRPDFFFFFLCVEEVAGSDIGVEDEEEEEASDEDKDRDDTVVDDDDMAVLMEPEDDAEDTTPPKICARRTSPTPEPQQAVLSPQHQRSPSARPLQDVTCVLPKLLRVCSQTSRHLPPFQSGSVQKFAKYLHTGAG
jgi:hypothetical protein